MVPTTRFVIVQKAPRFNGEGRRNRSYEFEELLGNYLRDLESNLVGQNMMIRSCDTCRDGMRISNEGRESMCLLASLGRQCQLFLRKDPYRLY